MRFFYLALHEIGQDFRHPPWERRLVVTPAPDRHLADAEYVRCRGVAAKDDLEEEIMPAAGQAALEAR
jgi:hypothetical protein